MLVDLNGDGRKDLVTGKRYMAHNGKDPGEREPFGVYWYEYRPLADGKRLDWTRHLVDYSTRAGGGMQIAVADFDKDGDLDLAAGGKAAFFCSSTSTGGLTTARVLDRLLNLEIALWLVRARQ